MPATTHFFLFTQNATMSEQEESSLPPLPEAYTYVLLIQHNDALRQEPEVKFCSTDIEQLRKYVQRKYCQDGYCKETSEDEWTLRYEENADRPVDELNMYHTCKIVTFQVKTFLTKKKKRKNKQKRNKDKKKSSLLT